ncbi:hypothetical protein GCM10009808_25210 [Microbacterium sediminicola]|uniref:DUF2202 domain-containing protein n=1 Tax=Microbacterium sediminicola TaxID=415210 RepID=A0ABP4UK66_9MICO
MNKTTRTATAVSLSALVALGLTTGGALAASATVADTAAAASVSEDMDMTLAYMREEERLARDLYAAIAEYYDGARPFSMITNSEDHHFDAVGTLLETYDIDDPSAGLAAGVYADDELQALYDELLAKSQTSIEAAYEVGITIEETDIVDLQAALAFDYPSDVDAVLQNLLNGSENHLAAYTAAADGTTVSGSGSMRSGTASKRGQGSMAGRSTQNTANAQHRDGDDDCMADAS